jgi:hypothetical protein
VLRLRRSHARRVVGRRGGRRDGRRFHLRHLRRHAVNVHVDEMTSEVIAEPEQASQVGDGDSDQRWAEEERHRWIRERLASDRLRTAAEGFDD